VSAKHLTRGVGLFVGTVLVLGMILALADEGVRLYRGWKNTTGSAVPGYGLYEKQYSSPLVERELQKIRASRPGASQFLSRPEKGWELVDFSQWQFACRFQARAKQRAWTTKRQRLLKEPSLPEGPLFTEADLPVERYRCAPMKMLYQPGQGWGFF